MSFGLEPSELTVTEGPADPRGPATTDQDRPVFGDCERPASVDLRELSEPAEPRDLQVIHPPATPTRRRFLLGAAAVAFGGAAVPLLSRFSAPAPPAQLTLATGPRGAVFVEVGTDLANAVHGFSPGTRVAVQETAATVDNLRRLSLRTADLGFASLDAAAVDSMVRLRGITALGRVYDSFLHLVVLAGSTIQNVRDLTGRRVSVGGAGSGTEFTALRLMESAGIVPSQVQRLGQTPSMKAVADGSVDAAFSLTGYPTPAIADLAQRREIRLVPLVDSFGFLDRAISRVYVPAPIPAGAYWEVDGVDTVLVPNVLLARPDLPDVAVALMMNALFDDSSRRYWVHPESKRISLDLAKITGPVLLHPAAQAWLDGHGR